MIPHNRVTISEDALQQAAEQLGSCQWTTGETVNELQNKAAIAFEVPRAIAVGSGFSALRLSLDGLGVGPGTSVVVPAYCCVAIPNAVKSLGAFPIVVDVDRDRWVMNENAIEKAVRHRTRAIVVVNTFGIPADIPSVELPVVEDGTHGFPLGVRGTVGVMSLGSTKLLSTPGGGLVLTRHDALANNVLHNRHYDGKAWSAVRGNDAMSDVSAAVALAHLKGLKDNIEQRHRIANRYMTELDEAKEIGPPWAPAQRTWYRFTVAVRRNGLASFRANMELAGVKTATPIDPWIIGFENADRAALTLVSIPCYPSLTLDEVDTIVTALKNAP